MAEQKPLFNQFDRIAQAYDSITFVQVPAQRVVEVAKLAAGESVLDVACGTGWLTIPAAQAVGPNGRVYGVDIAAQMIALATAKAAAADVPTIEFAVMNGQSPDFAPEQFDVILCGLALFAFPDIKLALTNWQRCLKPGGRVVFSAWQKGFFHQFDMLAARFNEVSGGNVTGNIIEKLDSVAKCRAYLEETNYSDIAVQVVDMSYYQPTLESYWAEVSSTVDGLKLNQLTPEQQRVVRERHLEDVGQQMTSEGVRIEAPLIIASAYKAIE